MTSVKNSIICPNCSQSFELSEAFRGHMREEVEKDVALELQDLKNALSENEKKVEAMREQELTLREEKRKLLEKEKEMSIELQRQLDVERKKIEDTVFKETQESHRMKDLEKDKKIQDLMQSLDDARRKAQQGSQQTQGEVMELDLEKTLMESFPHDDIEPVGKGVRGADIKQIVKSPKGFPCGVILWESKHTKAWTDSWTTKLKEDLRAEKANVPVIVSTALPDEAKPGFGIKDNVWVVSYSLVLPLASILRKNLLDLGFQKAISQRQTDKAGLLFNYMTGHEFIQQMEALAEIYKQMHAQIAKERAAFEKIWKEREGQVKRLVLSTASVYGSIQGLVGSSMPQLKGFDIMELESGEEV